MAASSTQKNVYVVLGMARNGTSVITRGLQALGIDLGDRLYPANQRNPKGFYEDIDVVYKINRSVLYILDYPMMASACLKGREQYDHPLLNQFKHQACKLLRARLENTNHWAFKDPRTVRILPFWQSVFNALAFQDHYVIVLRNPLASAHSNQKLTNKDIEGGLISWLIHLISAIEGTHEKQRVVVSYEMMMASPKQQLNRLKEALASSLSTAQEAIDNYAKDFIDTSLHHHTFNDEDLKNHSATLVAPLCVEVYAVLKELACDQITFQSDAFKQAWQKIMLEFSRIHPFYEYLFSILREQKQLERELRTIRKSLPWQLLYPLRLIDDILRAHRKRKREKKKLINAYG